MARINTENVVNKKSYIFENQADKESSILSAVKAEANNRRLDVQIDVEQMKSGGMFTGTKEEVITITRGKFSPIYIITRPEGTYLYVSIVTMAATLSLAELVAEASKTKVDDIFKAEAFSAYWNACIATLETAFDNLDLKSYEPLKGI